MRCVARSIVTLALLAGPFEVAWAQTSPLAPRTEQEWIVTTIVDWLWRLSTAEGRPAEPPRLNRARIRHTLGGSFLAPVEASWYPRATAC